MRGWKQIQGETADIRPSTPDFPFGRDFYALLDAVRSERTFAEGPYVEWSPSRLSELLREELPGAEVMICRTGSRIFTMADLWFADFAARPTPDVMARSDNAPDRRMDRLATHRISRLGKDAALSHSRSRRRLWRDSHTASSRPGDP